MTLSDAIGYRGWCKRCTHGTVKGKRVTCSNKDSQFFGLDVTCILCAPCIKEDKNKLHIEVEPISFD